jgi:hypothetical protein
MKTKKETKRKEDEKESSATFAGLLSISCCEK